MPVHDWTKVFAGVFHDFHHAWIGELRNKLNDGLLPDGFYALAEQVTGYGHPDVLVLEAIEEEWERVKSSIPEDSGAVAVAECPPEVTLSVEAEQSIYAAKKNRVAIRHVSDDHVVAYIEIISPGNKQSPNALTDLFEKLSKVLRQQRHLLLIDLFPPGKHDPNGIHPLFWEYLYGEHSDGATKARPLTLAAYRARDIVTAYVEPVAIGAPLPQMPLFLDPEWYINVPLEETYQAAYRGVPRRWKRVIEGGDKE
jgi:hypothetical protein